MEEECVEATTSMSNHKRNAIENQRIILNQSRESPLRLRTKNDKSFLTPGKNLSVNPGLLEKLSRMVDNCIKMECGGCRKLIPTNFFYEHLM